jgi:predicted butyrate kinase (DUF1464 family)
MLTHEQFAEITNVLLNGSFADIEKMAKSKEIAPLQAIIAGALVGGYRRREFRTLDQILNRLVGKPL